MPRLPKRYGRNVVSQYLYTAVAAVVALVMTPVLVHGLGKEQYGIWVLVASFALYFELLEFGFGTTTIKFVAEYDARDDGEGLRRAIATSFWVLAIPGVLALALGLALAFGFPSLFGISESLAGAVAILVLVVAFDVAVSIPGDTFGGTLVGLQRFDLVNYTLVAVTAAQAIGWAIVLAAGGGLVALGIVTVSISLTGQFARYLLARRVLGPVGVPRSKVDRALARRFTTLSGWYSMAQIAELVLVRIDTVVVGLVVGVKAAAVYAVGQKLVLAVEQIAGPSVRAFLPFASELDAKRDDEALRGAVLFGTRVTVGIATPLCVTLGLLAVPAIHVWVGAGFSDAAQVIVYLAGALVIASFARTGSLTLQGMGRPRMPALISASEGALNLLLSVALGTAIGLKGVALASLIAAAATQALVFLPYVCREFRVSLRSLVGSLLLAHLPAVGLAGAVGLFLRGLGLDSIPAVLAAGTAVTATYLGVLTFTGLDRGERLALADTARRLRPARAPG